MVRRLLLVAILPLALAACSDSHEAATTASAKALPALDPRHLPSLPPEVLAIRRGGGVTLAATDGQLIGTLDGYGLQHDDLGDGWLRLGKDRYRVRREAHRLDRVVAARAVAEGIAFQGSWCTRPEVIGHDGSIEWINCYRGRGTRGVLTTDSLKPTVPAPKGALVGHWSRAMRSPDGERLLLQWSGECESPSAYIAPRGGGTARPVVSDPAAESMAVGWTADSRALVLLPKGACGSGTKQPGVYAVTGQGVELLARGTDALLLHLS